MQPVGAALPELDLGGHHAVAAPRLGACHLAAGEALGGLGSGRLQRGAVGHGLALRRGPGVLLAAPGARGEVGVGLRGRHRLDVAHHAHLAVQRDEAEAQRGLRVVAQLRALAAGAVGVEDEAALVVALEQHEAGRGPAGGVGRGHHHGGAVVGVGVEPLPVPGLEHHHRVGVEVGPTEPVPVVGLAPLRHVDRIGHGPSLPSRRPTRRMAPANVLWEAPENGCFWGSVRGEGPCPDTPRGPPRRSDPRERWTGTGYWTENFRP